MLQGGHERLPDRQTDRQTGWIQYTLPNFVAGGINMPLNQSSSNSHKRFENFTNLGILCPKETGIAIYNMTHHYTNICRKLLCNQEYTEVYWGIQRYAGGNQRLLGVLWGIPSPQKFENLSKGTTHPPKNPVPWVYAPLIGSNIPANMVISPLRAKYYQREQNMYLHLCHSTRFAWYRQLKSFLK